MIAQARRRPFLLALCLAAAGLLLAGTAAAAKKPKQPRPIAAPAAEAPALPTLLDRLPRDPIMVSVANTGNLAAILDTWRDLAVRFGGEEFDAAAFDAGIAEFEQKLGCSVRDDLLARIGPEIAFVLDLPPIDSLAAGAGDPTAIPAMLSNLGLVAGVQGAAELDACMRKLFTLSTGRIVEENGMVRVVYPVPGSGAGEGQSLSVYYAIRDGAMALGVTPAFVESSMAPRAAGQRLADGADFGRVFAHLDTSAHSLTYLNLPKVGEMARSSQMVQSISQTDNEAAPLLAFLLDTELMATGAGSTSREVEGGTRTTSFGPSMLSGGGAATTGIIAAIAIPNMLNAIDRGKQKRTMADLRSAATACEAFAVDNNRYPGPTDGWTSIDAIAADLEPVYIRTLPRQDAWGHRFLYWSDGKRYRLVSPGKDGILEREWVLDAEGGTTAAFDADIVFGDGVFVQRPEGTQE